MPQGYRCVRPFVFDGEPYTARTVAYDGDRGLQAHPDHFEIDTSRTTVARGAGDLYAHGLPGQTSRLASEPEVKAAMRELEQRAGVAIHRFNPDEKPAWLLP